jgi:hypothetical protein
MMANETLNFTALHKQHSQWHCILCLCDESGTTASTEPRKRFFSGRFTPHAHVRKKKSTRKWRLSRRYTHKQSACTAQRKSEHFACAHQVFSDAMNAMLGTFLMKIELLPTRDWIQSRKKIFKWAPFSRSFLRNILSNQTKTSCHSYSL